MIVKSVKIELKVKNKVLMKVIIVKIVNIMKIEIEVEELGIRR